MEAVTASSACVRSWQFATQASAHSRWVNFTTPFAQAGCFAAFLSTLILPLTLLRASRRHSSFRLACIKDFSHETTLFVTLLDGFSSSAQKLATLLSIHEIVTSPLAHPSWVGAALDAAHLGHSSAVARISGRGGRGSGGRSRRRRRRARMATLQIHSGSAVFHRLDIDCCSARGSGLSSTRDMRAR